MMDSTQSVIDGTDLIRAATALQWHEAVAIVLQLVDTVKRSGAPVPDLSHIRLSSDGAIAILPGSPAGGNPASVLAVDLRLLLNNSLAPSELSDVVLDAINGRSQVGQSIEDFAAALRYFERPDREKVVRGVVARAIAEAATEHTRHEMELLVAKARESAIEHMKEGSKPVAARRRPRKAIVISTVVPILLVAIAAFAARHWADVSSGARAIPSAVSRAQQALNGKVAGWFGEGGGTASAPEPEQVQPAVTKKPTVHAASRTKKVEQPESAPQDVSPTGTTGSIGTFVPADVELSMAFPLTTGSMVYGGIPVVEPELESGRVYSRRDKGVTPPVPLHPFIGRVTSEVAPAQGDMEVLVGSNGSVERVTLVGPNRFEDWWLLLAMKNRQFKPAMAQGRPVKYVLRIRTVS